MVFENLVPPLCAFAPLRLGENESSNSGGGSRKGAKTQRSQREDPGFGWTKFSKTIKAGLGAIAAAAAEEALSYLFLKDHYSAPMWRVNIKVRIEARFYLGRSFLTTPPPFITNLTRLSSVMSLSGSPATAIRSANLPASTLPARSCQPISSAALVVAARMVSICGRPASTIASNMTVVASPRFLPG